MKKIDDNPLYTYTLHLHLTLQSLFTLKPWFADDLRLWDADDFGIIFGDATVTGNRFVR